MKITIDTKEDSKEEIKKIIQMLSSLLGEEVKVNKDLFSAEETGSNDAFVNMFGDNKVEEKKESEEEEDTPSVVSY